MGGHASQVAHVLANVATDTVGIIAPRDEPTSNRNRTRHMLPSAPAELSETVTHYHPEERVLRSGHLWRRVVAPHSEWNRAVDAAPRQNLRPSLPAGHSEQHPEDLRQRAGEPLLEQLWHRAAPARCRVKRRLPIPRSSSVRLPEVRREWRGRWSVR